MKKCVYLQKLKDSLCGDEEATGDKPNEFEEPITSIKSSYFSNYMPCREKSETDTSIKVHIKVCLKQFIYSIDQDLLCASVLWTECNLMF